MTKIVNEYEMTPDRYFIHTVPEFSEMKYFKITMYAELVLGILFIFTYFIRREKTIGMIILCLFFFIPSVTIFRKKFHAQRAYSLIKRNYCDGKKWMSKNEISDEGVKVYINDTLLHDVKWDRIKKWTEAVSYYSIKWASQDDSAVFYKDSFKEGEEEAFLSYLRNEHKEIPFEIEIKEFNK